MSSRKNYKQLIIQAREMRGQSGLSAYDRAKILVDVFNDRDFRTDVGNVDDFGAADALDQYVDDLCVSFLQLKAMFEHFPNREQWKEGMLFQMHAEVIEKGKQAPEGPTRTRKSVTTKEYEKVVEEKQAASTRAEYLNKELEAARKRIDELTSENRELAEKYARAEGRIGALEEMLAKKKVA